MHPAPCRSPSRSPPSYLRSLCRGLRLAPTAYVRDDRCHHQRCSRSPSSPDPLTVQAPDPIEANAGSMPSSLLRRGDPLSPMERPLRGTPPPDTFELMELGKRSREVLAARSGDNATGRSGRQLGLAAPVPPASGADAELFFRFFYLGADVRFSFKSNSLETRIMGHSLCLSSINGS
jgi:hypothetical protein